MVDKGTSACQDSGEDDQGAAHGWSRPASAADHALCCNLKGKQWMLHRLPTLPGLPLLGFHPKRSPLMNQTAGTEVHFHPAEGADLEVAHCTSC